MELILISSCLIGKKVRYNGQDCKPANQILDSFFNANILVPICPEVSSGLPVPRLPAEIRNYDKQQNLKGPEVVDSDFQDISSHYFEGANTALQLCQRLSIKMAILKELSPSCGVNEIYDGTFSSTKIKGMGITTSLLRRHGIKVFSEFQLSEAYEYYKKL